MHNAITTNCYHYTTHSPCTCNVHSSSHPLMRSPSPPPPCSSHVLLPGGKPKTHTSHPPRHLQRRPPLHTPTNSPSLQLADFPTSRKANKPKSWQVGKLANWQAPTPCTTTPSLSFTPHPTLPTPCTRARCILPLCTPPVTVTAQCSHCTLLSLHLAITSSGLPANFPTLQVSDFPTSRKVGKSESWQVPPPVQRGGAPAYRGEFITPCALAILPLPVDCSATPPPYPAPG